MRYTPFIKKIDFYEDVLRLYRVYAGEAPSVLLESARISGGTGRYSILAARPYLIFSSKNKLITTLSASRKRTRIGEPLQVLKKLLKDRQTKTRQDFLPFTGGGIGYFSYEAKNLIEKKLSQKSTDDLKLPDIYFLFFDRGLVIDHSEKCTYLFIHSKNKNENEALKRFEKEVRGAWKKNIPVFRDASVKPPFFRVKSVTSKARFLNNIREAKRRIREGDIYQANLSQRFDFVLPDTPLQTYSKLRKANPSSFFAYLDAGGFQIISGSPERLLRLRNGILDTRPIAGTRPRGKKFGKDETIARELILNPKERAEHIMLVDLERNDLGRVCEYGSVVVNELMALEDYSHVKHIVSNIEGRLMKGKDALDAFKAFFPGGTITGTPKIKCMNIIDELEGKARGPYTGSLGYFSFTGDMDFNIIIRSVVVKGKTAHLQVGAGIVADSIPEREYDETLYKAKGVFAGIFGEKQATQILRKLGTRN